MTLPPAESASDPNSGDRRQDWSLQRSPDDDFLLRRDAASYLKQAVSTPCLTSIQSADGAYIFGSDGTPYLDFHGNSSHQIGYGHPKLVSALRQQMATLPFVPRRFTSGVSVEFAWWCAQGRGPRNRAVQDALVLGVIPRCRFRRGQRGRRAAIPQRTDR